MSSLVKASYQSPADSHWENDLSLWCLPTTCRFELSFFFLILYFLFPLFNTESQETLGHVMSSDYHQSPLPGQCPSYFLPQGHHLVDVFRSGGQQLIGEAKYLQEGQDFFVLTSVPPMVRSSLTLFIIPWTCEGIKSYDCMFVCSWTFLFLT